MNSLTSIIKSNTFNFIFLKSSPNNSTNFSEQLPDLISLSSIITYKPF